MTDASDLPVLLVIEDDELLERARSVLHPLC